MPSRKGSLNYYDDSTHKGIPPNFDKCISIIKENGLTIKYSTRRYRPIFLSLVGFILEPYSIVKKQVTFGTWEYYGFESIIWAIKK